MQINIPTEKISRAGHIAASRIKRIRRWPKWAWFIVLGAIVAGAAVWIILTWPEPPKPDYPIVEAQPVVIDDVEIYGEYAGKISAQQFVEIRARVEGYLEEMLFEEGTYIKKNQVLFIIDPKPYKANVEKAKAQLNKNKALELKAERALERIRPLFEQNPATRLDLANAIASYESARAEVVMSQADLTQAEIALGYTTVRSPISGFISERNVDLGTLVGPGGKSLLATMVKSDTVQVNFSMTSLDYLKSRERNVNLGQQDTARNWNPYVTITLADNSEYPMKGFLDFADPQVDPNTGTFSVRAEMANPDHILLPGQMTKVRLLLDVREDAIIVPTKALVIEKGGAYVFACRRDSVVEERFIELGPEIGNNVVVERGLGPDEMIIVEGFHKLSHGIKVAPVIVKPEPVPTVPDSEGRYSLQTDSTDGTADTAQSKVTPDNTAIIPADTTTKVTKENEK